MSWRLKRSKNLKFLRLVVCELVELVFGSHIDKEVEKERTQCVLKVEKRAVYRVGSDLKSEDF